MTEEIAGILDGTAQLPRFPEVTADVLTTRYIAGHYMTVSEQKKVWKKGEGPLLERLVEVDEVWAICFRKPPPGWRLLGRFLDKDVFVGLRFIDKPDLAGRYKEVSAEVVGVWDEHFDFEPIRSASLDDYIGHTWVNKDEEDAE